MQKNPLIQYKPLIDLMAQQPKQKKTKGGEADKDKKNTDLWKEKQAQKKKEKQQKQKEGGGNDQSKEDKKQKKKKQKQKDAEKEKEKTGNPKEQTKQQDPKDKKSQPNATTGTQPTKQQPKKYKKIDTVESLIISKNPQLLENRTSQIDLIEKEVLNLIRPGDTVLYLGKLGLRGAKLVPGSGKGNFKLVEVPGYTSHPDSELVCRYEDLPYLLSQQIDKVFIQASILFRNGSALVPKGYQNIALTAEHYNKPIVLTSGSWHYTKHQICSYNELQQLYDPSITDRYDWIDCKMVDVVCMEIGAVLPCAVGLQVEQGYRAFGIDSVKW